MKKLLISFISFLFFISVYSQNSYNLEVRANFIRIWAAPSATEIVPNSFLKLGEKVRLIGVIIEDKEGRFPRGFCRIYRNGDNNKPYYLNIAEANIDLGSLQIKPSSSAIIEEKNTDNVWNPFNNTFHKKGDILFINGKNTNGLYSYLNKAALKESDVVYDEFPGFYVIEHIVKGKVEGTEKIFFYCKPLKTPFNQQNKNIYIDFLDSKNNILFQSLSYKSNYFNLMSAYAYKYPVGEVPNQFYTHYLSSLYSEPTIANWDEFKKQKIISSGKTFMDSIYKERMRIFNISQSEVYFSEISEYDFNSRAFKILTFTNGDKMSEYYRNINLVETWPKGNSSTYDLLNIFLFTPELRLNVDSAESFLKEIRKFPVNDKDRGIVLIPYYKYISIEKAKAIYKKVEVDLNDFENQKQIDSIEVYTGKVLANSFVQEDRKGIKKWLTLYPKPVVEQSFHQIEGEKVFTKVSREAAFPGGGDAWNRYVERNIKYDDAKPGTYKVRFIVDKEGNISEVEALTMKGTKLSDALINAMRKGPRWQPAVLSGRNVNAYGEKEIIIPN